MNYYFLITLLLICQLLRPQGPVGSWADHLPYSSVKFVAVGEKEVLGSTDYSLTVYNKDYNELRKLSKVNGLTDCGINTIAYSSEHDLFIIAYTSSNIDIYENGTITNIPDINNKYITGTKDINRIRISGSYGYLATSFGIVLVDLVRFEIHDTWKPSDDGNNNNVHDIAFTDDKIYAATEQGIFSASLNESGLSFFENWEKQFGSASDAIFNSIAAIGYKIYFNKKGTTQSGDSIFTIENNTVSFHNATPGISNHTFEISNHNLIISSGSVIRIVDQSGQVVTTISSYDWTSPNANNSIIDGNDIYIADLSQGLVRGEGLTTYYSYIPPGPFLNNCSNINSDNGVVYVAGGLVNNAWNNTWRTFQMYTYKDGKWTSILDSGSWDVMRIRPFPGDNSRIFVSTWGSGVYEFSGNLIVNHYDETNSPLETIIPGAKYVRICGLAFDTERNLWMTQSGMENSIKILKPDGSWIVLPYTIEAPTIGDIIISRTGKKWVVLPRGYGLFVLDDHNTPDNFDDDEYRKLSVKDQDGNPLPNIYSIAEDLDGNIWIGTDQGPAVFYNPDQVFDREIFAFRVKIPRNDGTGLADYLLETEIITAIAIDGGNRKWLGTNSSGAFLISEDGRDLIRNYNESNSPVLSNIITSVAVNGSDGEVWIGTDKGLVTVRELATEGAVTMINVYAFPNPVKEDWNGDVIITGLSREANIKITDVSGNLVYETFSVGGQATWDLRTFDNRKVTTGVYLIFCSSKDGSDTYVSKLLVIR